MKSTDELSISGTKFIDKVMARIDKELLDQLESHLMAKASMIANTAEFCRSLARQNFTGGSDAELKSGPDLQEVQGIESAIRAVCSNRAIGSLVLALQQTGNEHFLEETCEWLETLQAEKKNLSISVKSLASQRIAKEFKALTFTFFQQAGLPDGLTKLAKFEQNSATKGISALQFDQERLIACSTDGALSLWSFRSGEDQPINIAVERKKITCFQYDEEILIVGNAVGYVRLFDARTYEEKYTVWIGDAVTSLKFFESTLVVFTRDGDNIAEVCWIEISRPDMRLFNQMDLDLYWGAIESQVPSICMYTDASFLYYYRFVSVHDTKSGKAILDENKQPCSLTAPYEISTLNVSDVASGTRVIVAGCANGTIGVWNTSKFMCNASPVKCLYGHLAEIISICAVGGHVVSLDKSGKLLMWSGYDVGDESNCTANSRVLAGNFSHVSSLSACERWFASGSSEDGTVNIWTLPDLWLRTG